MEMLTCGQYDKVCFQRTPIRKLDSVFLEAFNRLALLDLYFAIRDKRCCSDIDIVTLQYRD